MDGGCRCWRCLIADVSRLQYGGVFIETLHRSWAAAGWAAVPGNQGLGEALCQDGGWITNSFVTSPTPHTDTRPPAATNYSTNVPNVGGHLQQPPPILQQKCKI